METPRQLRKRAARYRAMANFPTDRQTSEALQEMAREYEALAAALEASGYKKGDDTSAT